MMVASLRGMPGMGREGQGAEHREVDGAAQHWLARQLGRQLSLTSQSRVGWRHGGDRAGVTRTRKSFLWLPHSVRYGKQCSQIILESDHQARETAHAKIGPDNEEHCIQRVPGDECPN